MSAYQKLMQAGREVVSAEQRVTFAEGLGMDASFIAKCKREHAKAVAKWERLKPAAEAEVVGARG